MIGPFEGKYAFLSNFHECANPVFVDVFLRGSLYRLPCSHVEGPYQLTKCASTVAHQHFFQKVEGEFGLELAWPPLWLPPNECKKIGKQVYLREDWEDAQVRVSVMRPLITDKFWVNPELAEALLATGPEPLVEVNWWHDNFWGDCICPKCKDKPGLNWLGRIEMEVRAELELNRRLLPVEDEVGYVFR